MFASSKEALQAAINASQAVDDDIRDTTLIDALKASIPSRLLDLVINDELQPGPANNKKRKATKSRTHIDVSETFAGWGCSGPLMKLHELAVHIRVSTIHHDQWLAIVGRDIGIDNANTMEFMVPRYRQDP